MKIFALILVSSLSLTACGVSSEWMGTRTQSMPNGYYYHGNQKPITKPAPSRPWYSKKMRDTMGVSTSVSSSDSSIGSDAKELIPQSKIVSQAQTVPDNDSKPLPYKFNN